MKEIELSVCVRGCPLVCVCRSVPQDSHTLLLSFMICNTPPDKTPPSLTDAHISAFQLDGETLHVGWGGFKDKESNVKRFQACIGSTPGGEDIVECENVELDQLKTFTFSNFTGLDGVFLYASVFAENGEELESMLAARIEIDDSAPEVRSVLVERAYDGAFVDTPLLKHNDTRGLQFMVQVVEPNSELHVVTEVVEYAIGLGPDSYQDACEWTEVVQNFTANPWALVSVSDLELQFRVKYYIHIRTGNTVGTCFAWGCGVLWQARCALLTTRVPPQDAKRSTPPTPCCTSTRHCRSQSLWRSRTAAASCWSTRSSGWRPASTPNTPPRTGW